MPCMCFCSWFGFVASLVLRKRSARALLCPKCALLLQGMPSSLLTRALLGARADCAHAFVHNPCAIPFVFRACSCARFRTCSLECIRIEQHLALTIDVADQKLIIY
jgi:hypothetical protein